MTKQEFIELAYGDLWEKVKDHLDGIYVKAVEIDEQTSPVDYVVLGLKEEDIIQVPLDYKSYLWIPKSIFGASDNNGWFKIEEVLPGESDLDLEVCVNGVYSRPFFRKPGNEISDYFKSNFSHWRPMRKIINPLY